MPTTISGIATLAGTNMVYVSRIGLLRIGHGSVELGIDTWPLPGTLFSTSSTFIAIRKCTNTAMALPTLHQATVERQEG